MSLGETIICYNLGELFIVRSIPVWPVWVEYMFGVRAGVFFLFFFFFFCMLIGKHFIAYMFYQLDQIVTQTLYMCF